MSLHAQIADLRQHSHLILPSLLLCDFGNLEREVERLEAAGVRALHLDVMDGQFVPNMTYGMPIVAAFRKLTAMPLDVHLMIHQPDRYLQAYVDAGADLITVHVEACDDPGRTLTQIRELGVAAGLALNPDTPIETISEFAPLCDLILVMSVNAGFGGQKFNPVALDKLQSIRELAGEDVILQVDGGINRDTIKRCAQAGAEWFVVGSGIFRQADYRLAVTELLELAAGKQ